MNDRIDFVFEGTKNTHVFEFGMVLSVNSKKDSNLRREIVTSLKQKTKEVRDYVCALKNKKLIRRWVALFSKDRGELVHVSEV